MDFKTAYTKIYRDIWDMHKKYHEGDYSNPDEFWRVIVDETTAYSRSANNSIFAVKLLSAMIDEVERVKHNGLQPNSKQMH